MKPFIHAHATHPDWRIACSLVLAQVRGRQASGAHPDEAPLGLLYVTEPFRQAARDVLDLLSAELPTVTDWVGNVSAAICAGAAEYWEEPAIALMLCDLDPRDYRVFSGVAPLALHGGGAAPFRAATALVHASAEAQDLQGLIAELAARMTGERVFGGVPSSRHGSGPQFAVSGLGNVAGKGGASGVYEGGVSGVAGADRVRLLQRVTQGCRPVSRVHEVTSAERNLLGTLDGERALDVLLRDLQIEGAGLPTLIAPVRATLVGLAGSHGATLKATGDLDENARVRHIIGLDPTRRALAVAEQVDEGERLVFCERSREAARADLLRICTEIREDIEAGDAPVGARGALYVSCSGRGGPHFGGPNAELDLIRHALGEIPLVGFFAGGEIAGQQLLGYTGVLTVFA